MLAWLMRAKITARHDALNNVRNITTQPHRSRIVDLLKVTPTETSGTPARIAGWVRTIRKQKHVAFASLQDGSTIHAAQVVLKPEQAASLSTGAAVVVQGQWVPSKGGSHQPFELQAEHASLQGQNDATNNPIQKKYHTAEFLRTLPHLRIRTPFNTLLLRLRSQIIADTTRYFHDEGFTQTHTPLITSSDCEGAGEVFNVDTSQAHRIGKTLPGALEQDIGPFFGSPKYLTVSSQLHLEAVAQSVGDVWTLSPTFRAEKSDTARHLSEFYMLEGELAFVNDLNGIMSVVERLIRHIAQSLRKSELGEELLMAKASAGSGEAMPEDALPLDKESLEGRWEGLCRKEWPRITFHQACSELKQAHLQGKVKFEVLPDDTAGLQTEHERYLADVLFKGPIFVTDYPRAVKPFYMAPSRNSLQSQNTVPTVACFDLLLPEVCEVVGGSMREHRLEELRENMRKQPALDWYLDLRRYGSVPHGGFGLGFDRLLGYLAGVKNIRDIVTFPRYYNRCLC